MIARRLVLLPIVLLTGCSEKPRAPALITESVFHSEALGLTFVAPEGWVLYAKAVPPPGSYNRPMRFVAYQTTDSDNKATLELYAIDLAEGQKLIEYLDQHPIGPERWLNTGSPTPGTIQQTAITRYSQSGTESRASMRREIVEFHRPGRCYLFVTSYKVTDTKSREQANRSIESAKWER